MEASRATTAVRGEEGKAATTVKFPFLGIARKSKKRKHENRRKEVAVQLEREKEKGEGDEYLKTKKMLRREGKRATGERGESRRREGKRAARKRGESSDFN